MSNLIMEVIVISINQFGARKNFWNRNIQWEIPSKPNVAPYWYHVTSSHCQASSPQICPVTLDSSPFIKPAELGDIARASELHKLILHLIKYFLFISLQPTTNQLYE